MKKTLIISAALCLFAASAFASGINLTVTACPNNTGAGNDAGTLDCLGGGIVTMLATFQPAEGIADLVGLDTRLSTLRYLHSTLGETYRPSPMIEKLVAEGRLGKKTGKGVYDYDAKGDRIR